MCDGNHCRGWTVGCVSGDGDVSHGQSGGSENRSGSKGRELHFWTSKVIKLLETEERNIVSGFLSTK